MVTSFFDTALIFVTPNKFNGFGKVKFELVDDKVGVNPKILEQIDVDKKMKLVLHEKVKTPVLEGAQ